MWYFRIVVTAAAAAVALTVLACCTGIHGLFVRPFRTVSCHCVVGCCVFQKEEDDDDDVVDDHNDAMGQTHTRIPIYIYIYL